MRILAVDLSSIYWTLALSAKNPRVAPEITIAEIGRLRASYDRIVICCDAGRDRRSFRVVSFPDYKAGRAERDAVLWNLLDQTIERCEAEGWHVFFAPSTGDVVDDRELYYEADDVVGTVTAWGISKGYPIDILSGDSDLAQLVDDTKRVRMLRYYNGVNALDDNGVKNWLNVFPSLVTHLKCLAGDDGDNYKALPGLGEKTALKMLDKYGDALAAVRGEMSRTDHKLFVRMAEAGIEPFERALACATIMRDVPLPLDRIEKEIERPTSRTVDDMPDDESEEMHEGSFDEPPTFEAEPIEQPSTPAVVEPPAKRERFTPTALAKSEPAPLACPPSWELALEPNGARQAMMFAEWAEAAHFWRKKGGKHAIFMMIAAGRAKGITAFDAINGMHVIEGTPCFGAHQIVAMVKASPLCEYLDVIEVSNQKAVAVTRRKGSKHEQRREMTIEDARTAGLVRPGSPWVKSPADMLVKAVQVKLCRMVYQDVIGASYAVEEMASEAP